VTIELAVSSFAIISMVVSVFGVWYNGSSPWVMPLAWLLTLGLYGLGEWAWRSVDRFTLTSALWVAAISLLFGFAYLVRKPDGSRWPRTLLVAVALITALLGRSVAEQVTETWEWLQGAEVRLPGTVIAGTIVLAVIVIAWRYAKRREKPATTS
jgi:hypothetical protein